jgi:peptidoglycan/xylan/chitin deacetylase (PgdA/CDA1 family)
MSTLITRRQAVKSIAYGTAGLISSTSLICQKAKRHIITLSFDDGFEKSSIKTAEIYEKYGLSACINIVAIGHTKDPSLPEEWHKWQAGDFELWNDLKLRGHEIMPHGYNHTNLTTLPLEEAKSQILKCLDVFNEELDGFIAKESIFNFPYNSSSLEIEEWIITQVRAFRTAEPPINPYPFDGMKRLTCTSYGPDNIDKHLEETINSFLEGPPAWLIYNTHGINDEGWGPVSSGFLDELLDRLTRMKNVKVLPVVAALDLA